MSTAIGGQAVLEGVMMRSPSSWAVAVRKPDGAIAQVVNEIASPMAKRHVGRLPGVRCVIALGESLAIGFRALAISANYAAEDPEKQAAARAGPRTREAAGEGKAQLRPARHRRGARGGQDRALARPDDLRVRDRDRLRGRAVQSGACSDHRPAAD